MYVNVDLLVHNLLKKTLKEKNTQKHEGKQAPKHTS